MSSRSEAARAKWADPEWRARMLEARARKNSAAKIAEAAKAKWQDPEYAERVRASRTPEARSAALTEEARRRISAKKSGVPRSAESVARQKATRAARGTPPDLRARLAAGGRWHKGRVRPPETGRAISRALAGRPSPFRGRRHTEEAKRRIGEGVARAAREGAAGRAKRRRPFADTPGPDLATVRDGVGVALAGLAVLVAGAVKAGVV